MATSVARAAGDDEVPEALERLIDLVNNLLKEGIVHAGTIIPNLALTTTNLEVRHGLGRPPTVCKELLRNADAVVIVDTPHEDPRNYIWVKASAAVTVNLLVA